MATADTVRSQLTGRRLPPTSQLLRWVFGLIMLLGVGLWLITRLLEEPDRFAVVSMIGFTNGSIYALVALGYTLVYGIIELINFAHGDNFMLGSFATHSVVNNGTFFLIPLGTAATAASSPGQRIYSIGMALLLAVFMCMVINVTIERIGYKPLRNQPRLAPLITAIGFSFILQNIGLAWKQAGRVPVNDVLPAGNVFQVRDIRYEWADFIVLVIAIPLLLLLTWLVKATKQGKAMRATAQDRDASGMMGINVDRTISFTFALGGALAGAGGFIYAMNVGTTHFLLGFRLGLFAFTAAVLGGIGNLTGAVVGGLVIGMVQAYIEGFGDARWTTTFIFSILILILVFRPSGILGEQTPEGQ